jgi:hypothetical protein
MSGGHVNSSGLLNCEECSARLAHDQRYCVECGARRGPLPVAIAELIGEHGESEAEVACDSQELHSPDSTTPSPSVIGAAVLALLAFGVLVGSAVSPVQESAAVAPIIVAVSPSTTASNTPPSGSTPTPPTAPEAKAPEAKPSDAATKAHHPLHKPKHAAATAMAATPEPEPPAKPAPKPAPLAAIQSPDAKKEPAPPVKLEGEGTLMLASSPWCNVKIDGVDKGPTPLSIKLPAGKHTVVLSNPEFKISRSLPVMILPNETARKRFDF